MKGISLLMIGMLVGFGFAQEKTSDDWVHERQTKDIPLLETRRIVVVNPYGDVRVRGYGDPKISLIANMQKRKLNPAKLTLKHSEEEGVVLVEVDFPSQELEKWKKPKRRVDLTVLLPKDIALELQMVDGLAEVRGFDAPLKIDANLSNIAVRTSGPVSLKNRQGEIKAVLTNPKMTVDSSIESTHGLIRVSVPQLLNAEVLLDTSGKISTDFSMTIDTQLNKNRKQGRAVLGKGGPKIHLKSKQADVELLRIMTQVEPDPKKKGS